MVSLEAIPKGDVYIDYPYEDFKFRFEKKTGKVFYSEPEKEIESTSELCHDAVSAGKLITRGECFRD